MRSWHGSREWWFQGDRYCVPRTARAPAGMPATPLPPAPLPQNTNPPEQAAPLPICRRDGILNLQRKGAPVGQEREQAQEVACPLYASLNSQHNGLAMAQGPEQATRSNRPGLPPRLRRAARARRSDRTDEPGNDRDEIGDCPEYPRISEYLCPLYPSLNSQHNGPAMAQGPEQATRSSRPGLPPRLRRAARARRSGRTDEPGNDRDKIGDCPEYPGRIEPRVLKRRRHRYPLMIRPRHQLRKELA